MDSTNTNPVPDQGNSGGNAPGGNAGSDPTVTTDPTVTEPPASTPSNPAETSPDPTSPSTGADPAPDPSEGSDPTVGSDAVDKDDPDAPVDSKLSSPVLGIVLGLLAAAAAGAGGWFGYQFWRKKKQENQ